MCRTGSVSPSDAQIVCDGFLIEILEWNPFAKALGLQFAFCPLERTIAENYFQRSIGANEHQSGWIAATHQIGDKIEWRNALGLAQPILSSKILDVGEFLLIIRDDGVTEGKCLSRNEQVICADWSASLLKPRAQQSGGSICRCLEGQNLERTRHGFQLGGESR